MLPVYIKREDDATRTTRKGYYRSNPSGEGGGRNNHHSEGIVLYPGSDQRASRAVAPPSVAEPVAPGDYLRETKP